MENVRVSFFKWLIPFPTQIFAISLDVFKVICFFLRILPFEITIQTHHLGEFFLRSPSISSKSKLHNSFYMLLSILGGDCQTSEPSAVGMKPVFATRVGAKESQFLNPGMQIWNVQGFSLR